MIKNLVLLPQNMDAKKNKMKIAGKEIMSV